jgi:sulfur relay (sulfurtransferase) DsrF/TusC family protein
VDSNLIIIKQAPYEGRSSSEIIEAVMSLALFDVEHHVVFFGEGLAWLLKNQSPENQKSIEKQLKALPIYGSESIHYCLEHKANLFPETELSDLAEPVSLGALSSWIREAKHVEVF